MEQPFIPFFQVVFLGFLHLSLLHKQVHSINLQMNHIGLDAGHAFSLACYVLLQGAASHSHLYAFSVLAVYAASWKHSHRKQKRSVLPLWQKGLGQLVLYTSAPQQVEDAIPIVYALFLRISFLFVLSMLNCKVSLLVYLDFQLL